MEMKTTADRRNEGMAECLLGAQEISEPSGARNRPDTWKVIVADDEDEVHAMTRMVLSDYVFEGRRLQFLNAYSGADCMHLMHQHPETAVILLDVVMESDDAGLQVVRRIRARRTDRPPYIILLTAQLGSAILAQQQLDALLREHVILRIGHLWNGRYELHQHIPIAKAFGAEVTGVCSAANADLVRSLGADHVIDYTREDYSARGPMYEAILDAVGKSQRSQYTRALTPNGTFATVAKLATKQSLEELTFVKELIEAGKLRAVLDRCYPLEGVVEAHRYVDMGHKAGNVVIAVG